MYLQEEIFDLFNKIRDNEDRVNSTFDDSVDKIKSLLSGKLNSEQTTIYLDWCNNKCPKFREDYMSNIGGVYTDDDFQNPILDIVLDIENNNS